MFAATKLKLFKLSFNNCAPKLPYTLTQLTQPNPTNVNICLCVCVESASTAAAAVGVVQKLLLYLPRDKLHLLLIQRGCLPPLSPARLLVASVRPLNVRHNIKTS